MANYGTAAGLNQTSLNPKKASIWKRMRQEPWLLALIIVIFASLFLFTVYPIYQVFKITVVTDKGLDLSPILNTLGSRSFLQAFWNSMQLGVIAAVISTLIGFVFAYANTRTNMKGKPLFHLIALLPIVSPPFVIALSVILLFGRNGMITSGLFGWQGSNVYGLTSLVVIQTMSFFPIAYLNLKGILESIDTSVENAALSLGASRWKVFRTITMPLAIPGIFSALLIVFIKSIEDFGNPMVIAGDYSTLAVEAYLQITGMYDLRGGAIMAVAILFPAMTTYFIQKYWLSKKSYVTITGKPSHQEMPIRDRYIVWPLFAFCTLITGAIVIVYGTVIWGAFVKIWGVNNTLTFDNFRYIFARGVDTITNSLKLAVISTPITALIGMIIAYLIIRKAFIGKRLMEFSSMLTFAVPGTVVGIGYILAFNEKPFLLTGTAAIIIICLTFRNMPVGIEGGTNSLRQVDPSIEEASAILGANNFTTFRKISLPLMRPALFSALVYSFVKSMTSISAIIFLVSVNWNLMTVTILSQVEGSRLGVAAAYCVMLIAIVLAALGILQLLVNLLGPKKRRSA